LSPSSSPLSPRLRTARDGSELRDNQFRAPINQQR
jgi:hypothetical protein